MPSEEPPTELMLAMPRLKVPRLKGGGPVSRRGGGLGTGPYARASLEEALAAPGGCAATVPARLTTQVEVILGDKSPTAVQRCTTSAPRNPWTPDRSGGCRLGPRRVRHAGLAAVAGGTGSASTPERRLPGHDPPPEVPRPLVEIVPGGAPPSRPANIRTVPADDWWVPPQAVHWPQRICLLNAMRMIVPATQAVRAMEPPWFFSPGLPVGGRGSAGLGGSVGTDHVFQCRG